MSSNCSSIILMVTSFLWKSTMPDQVQAAAPSAVPLLADHLALDLLNTEAHVGAQDVDFWPDGDGLVDWLARVGIDPGTPDRAGKEALLAGARELRAVARALVAKRKAGLAADPARLNGFLALVQSVPVLEWDDAGPRMTRRFTAPSPLRPLGVLAEAVAALLAEGDFDLVRQCEHRECVLWFYDRTKSHRRRWCSMAVCGNRHKAEQFRKRAAATAG